MMKEKITQILRDEPGLKGREIARRIGQDRKETNSFLDRNRETFHQDEKYKWYLKSQETIVQLPPGWIDADKFEGALSAYPDLFSCNNGVKFILPKGCSLLIESISRLLALMNQLVFEGVNVTVDLAESSKTRSFLSRAGFFDLLSPAVTVVPGRPKVSAAKLYKGNTDSLVEIGAICPNSKNKGLVVALRNTFISNSSVAYETVALTVFSEFVNNVSDHSGSKIDGFAALQCYNPPHLRKHIQAVISDSGLGVVATLRSTLREHYPTLHERFSNNGVEGDIGLVLEVFSKGNITRHGKASGRGLGFRSTREQASKFDADLSIRVDIFEIKLCYRGGELREPRVTRNLTRVKGTHICFDFYVDAIG